MLTDERRAELRRLWDASAAFVPQDEAEIQYVVSMLEARYPNRRAAFERIRADVERVFRILPMDPL